MHVQLFFKGFNQRYFIVQTDSVIATQLQVSLTEEQEDDKAQVLQEFKEARERDAEKQAVVEKEIKKSNNTS